MVKGLCAFVGTKTRSLTMAFDSRGFSLAAG